MEAMKLEANSRKESGKGAARRLKLQQRIPAVAYGKDLPATSIVISPHDLLKILGGEYGRNTVIELDIDGKQKVTSLLAEYQHHPVSRELLHADFIKIDESKPVDVEVPLELFGKSKGVVLGGTLELIFRRLPVRCLPKDIPVKITHDVSDLGIEEAASASDLKLPNGVTVRLPPGQTVAAVYGKRKEQEEEAQAAAGATPAAGAAAPGGAAGATPAAAQKKPAEAKKK